MKIRDHFRNVITGGRQPGPRGTVAEWTITLALFFFGTSTLVQAYVIPTGSMEGTILIGDHVLVDRLAYSDPGLFGKALLPYREIQRGDIIVFPYPIDPSQAYVKRVIGIPGDRHPYGRRAGDSKWSAFGRAVYAAYRPLAGPLS